MTLTAQNSGWRTGNGTPPRAQAPVLVCTASDGDTAALAAAVRRLGVAVTNDPGGPVDVATLIDRLRPSRKEPVRSLILTWPDLQSVVAAAAKPATAMSLLTVITTELPDLRCIHVLRRNRAAIADPGRGGPDIDPRSQDWSWIGALVDAGLSNETVAWEDLIGDDADRRLRQALGLDEPSIGPVQVLPTAADLPAPSAPVPKRRSTRTHAPRPTPPASVIVVSHNEGDKLALTVDSIRATVPDTVEIIVVDDWSTDGSAGRLPPEAARVIRPAQRGGVTGARNAGAAAAGGDILVFADAHVDPSPGWLAALCDALAVPGTACAGPTITPLHQRGREGHGFTWAEPQLRMKWLRSKDPDVHPAPFICGCLMAFRRRDFESVGGFDGGLMTWGSEDAEIGLNLWRHGRASVVVPQARVAHLFRPATSYAVQPHLIVHNTLRLAVTHLPPRALARVIHSFQHLPTFADAYERLLVSDVWERRDRIGATARHDGAWFLDRFRIEALR